MKILHIKFNDYTFQNKWFLSDKSFSFNFVLHILHINFEFYCKLHYKNIIGLNDKDISVIKNVLYLIFMQVYIISMSKLEKL